jgi:hypothetical protein
MDEAKMATFEFLQSLFEIDLILYSSKVIGDPISQRRKWAFFSGMIMVKIRKISKGGLHTKCLGIEVPGRAWLHLDRIGANPSHIGISVTDLPLESNRLVKIFLLFKWKAEDEEKVTEDSMLFQSVKTLHQTLIGIGMAFMHPPHPIRPDIG